MNIMLQPGTYVVAVSGGVDSVSLLHLLTANYNIQSTKLVVAHFDHGMREDSDLDRQLVQNIAKRCSLPFVYEKGNLGAGASEASARQARYDFLHKVRQASKADAVLTAHHQDDVIETILLNVKRGSGRKGLSSLRSHGYLQRPLLHMSKKQIMNYAKSQGLTWREDSTNLNTAYARNHMRHVTVSKLSKQERKKLINIWQNMQTLNDELDARLINYLHTHPERTLLDRAQFTQLPHTIAKEVMASWLRSHGLGQFDAKLLERAVWGAKTLRPYKQVHLLRGIDLELLEGGKIKLKMPDTGNLVQARL